VRYFGVLGRKEVEGIEKVGEEGDRTFLKKVKKH